MPPPKAFPVERASCRHCHKPLIEKVRYPRPTEPINPVYCDQCQCWYCGECYHVTHVEMKERLGSRAPRD